MELDVFEPRSSDERDGVKLALLFSEEGRLQDVAALSVLAEQALVQIHLFTRCLEVQGHWRRDGKMTHSKSET